jgi:hypothetical protein
LECGEHRRFAFGFCFLRFWSAASIAALPLAFLVLECGEHRRFAFGFSGFGVRRASPLCLWLWFLRFLKCGEHRALATCQVVKKVKRKTKAKGKAAMLAALQRALPDSHCLGGANRYGTPAPWWQGLRFPPTEGFPCPAVFCRPP